MSAADDPLLVERGLLGCVIRSRDVLDGLPPLMPGDFLDDTHGELWRVILDEAGKGKLRSWDAMVLASISGLDRAFLTSLQVTAPRGKDVAAEYARLIRQAAFDRRVRAGAERLLRAEASGEVLRALVERELTAVLDADLAAGGPRLLSDDLPAWLERKERMLREGPGLHITTGFHDIDERHGGLRPGEVMFVAGRPGTGKTQFALQIAEHNARLNKPIYVASMEMMDDQLINRMVSRQGVSAGALRNLHKRPDPEETLTAAIDASTKISALPIYVDYDSDSFSTLAAHVRRMKRQKNIAILIVDYLQLLSDDNGSGKGNRNEEVARISRGLKRLAVQLRIPIVALAQLNREMERAGGRRPQLADLRESGSIEQDADFVVFLWRHEQSMPQEGREPSAATDIVEVITAKGREVQPGTDYLKAQFRYARFLPVSAGDREAYLAQIRPAAPGSKREDAFV